MVPENVIQAAKKAQIRRLGQMPSQAMRKRCRKGKSCGAACIQSAKVCWVDFPWAMNVQINAVREQVRNRPPYEIKGSVGNYNKTRAKNTIKGILEGVKEEGANNVNGLVKEKDVNWRAALDSGVDYVGGGAFGAFVTVDAEKLVKKGGTRYPGGIGVKAGDIGKDEVEAIRKVGAIDMGPKLLAARLSKKDDVNENFDIVTNRGVIAMTKVPGTRLADLPYNLPIGGKTRDEAIMEAASKIHKIGISHNDMHGGNMYAGPDGKVRFVDFGLAKDSPKAALAEAMRQFGYQGNMSQVINGLGRIGISALEAENMRYDYGAGGSWDKVSNSQAMHLINMFYDGVV